jgi:transmembrane sensor
MDGKELTSLLAKYKKGFCTSEEKALLENWVAGVTYPEYQITEEELEYDLIEITGTLPLARRQNTLWPRILLAAAAVATIVFGLWFYTSKQPATPNNSEIVYQNDVLPGKHTATITLANGKTILLNASKTGVVIGEESLKYNDGTEVSAEASHNQMLTATTPRGGTYQVRLPDGTRVWMNADSKLSFPSKFSGKERKVLLNGEAYFEVAKSYRSKIKGDQSEPELIPFIVATDKQEVIVLGTHFNVNSYSDETVTKTTLLEGSVRVVTKSISSAFSTVLKPGEQAINSGNIQVEKVDAEESVAWKNGSIVFKDKTLEDIMRELSRWYDVNVVYAADAPKYETFSGAVSRTRNMSTVLERMQTTGSVRFKIEGRTITVTK